MIRLRWVVDHPIPDQVIRERLNKMRTCRVLTDMAISSGTKLLHCHQIILVHASTFIRELIKAKSQDDRGKLFIVAMGDEHRPYLEFLLQYLYLGTLLIDPNDFLGLCKLGDQLMTQFLVDGVQASGSAKGDARLLPVLKPIMPKNDRVIAVLPKPANVNLSVHSVHVARKLKKKAMEVMLSGNDSKRSTKLVRRRKKKTVRWNNREEKALPGKERSGSNLPSVHVPAVVQPVPVIHHEVGIVVDQTRPRRKAYEAATKRVKHIAAQLRTRSACPHRSYL